MYCNTFNLIRRNIPPLYQTNQRSLAVLSQKGATQTKPQNLIEKIVQKYTVDLKPGQKVQAGDFIFIQPEHVMTHDNTAAVMSKFQSIQAKRILNPRQPVYALDHDVQNKTDKNLAKYKSIQDFAIKHQVDFYPAGRGIGHQIMIEEGYAFPYNLSVASDSHSNMYGGIGSLGTPIVRTDAAAIWATGKTWWQVPPIAKVNLIGKLSPGVTGKDVIITLCGFFNKDEVLNHCIEFDGEGIAELSIDERLSIANMTTEWGALAGLFPVDEKTIQWYKNRINFLKRRDGKKEHPRVNDQTIKTLENNLLFSDHGSFYSKELTLDLSTVSPFVSGPNHVKVMKSVYEMEQSKLKIDKAYLVSCVNSRLEDIKQAADVVRGQKIAPHVKFYLAAASSEVQAEAEKQGYWKDLLDSGVIPLVPGCGPCVGLGEGLLAPKEVGISATNRNFKGRMGHPSASAFLASPAVVASSALKGYISAPFPLKEPSKLEGKVITNKVSANSSSQKVEIIPKFPEVIKGRVLYCHQDNLNTDGIYPGKYTYVDQLTSEEMAKVAMENYDPSFTKIVAKGDILVGGSNFGTGSSREQAATALKACGIQLLIAASFSETFKRNSINNAFLLLEVPDFVKTVKSKYGKEELTIPGDEMVIDFINSKITFEGKEYNFSPVGKAAQELMVEDGLENWIKARMN